MKHIKEVLDEVNLQPILKREIKRNAEMMLVIEDTIKELKKLKASLKSVKDEMGD